MKKNNQLIFWALLLFLGFWGEIVQAQSNQYLHFDREDDYVEVPNGSGYIANSSEISYAGWFYTDELAYGQGLMSIRGGGTGVGEMYLIQLSDGIVECRLITTDGFHEVVAPAFSIVPETWQHIAWVYDGNNVSLYIDGVLKGSSPASGTITAMDKPFTIGHCLLAGLNFVYGGRADEVSLWSTALSQGDIQDMMENELTGSETGLELYYKYNQGEPEGDNTSIQNLLSETGAGTRDGNLLNFSLMGATSNFGGVLDVGFQAISFPQVITKLITDDPFQLPAEASSGLPITYEVVSGPATVNGDIMTLNGTVGEVIVRASQSGDGTYDPAVDVLATINVVDPALNVPLIEIRSPLAGNVYVSNLKPIQLAAISNIEFPDLFEVSNLKFEIDGEEIILEDWGNEHYTGWWTPPALGSFDLNIIGTNNFGASKTETVSINITDEVDDLSVRAIDQAWVNVDLGTAEMEAELPSYLGAFDEIMGNLSIQCPNGGCDPWDRISGLEVKGHNGEWYEIIRYITPYGVPCNSSIDLTDFMSALQGKIRFRVYLGTFGNGFLYSLDLNYKSGEPEYPYSSINKLWQDTYDFGNPNDLQPCPVISAKFPENTSAAKIKLVASGHGWGENNTGNAAEFHEDTHHIWVDGSQTFVQHNWMDCNPNPDGCSPQNGTWFHDRAGWCPGAIAPWFDYDMADYIDQNSVELEYIFNEEYVDECHPNNSNCVSGVTCPNCNDGFNPHLIVASYLITKGDNPIENAILGTDPDLVDSDALFNVFPNPSAGVFNLTLENSARSLGIKIYNGIGQLMHSENEANPSSASKILNLNYFSSGIYTIEVVTENARGVKRIIIEK